MLTHITIRNFKGFEEVSFEPGDRVVFIGPNNSGKTSALVPWNIGFQPVGWGELANPNNPFPDAL